MEIAITITLLSLISIFLTKKHMMKYFVVASFTLSALAFFYAPTYDQDLFRHFIMLDEFRTGGWQFVLRTHYFAGQPVFAIYIYLISLLSYNGFLPAVTVFLAYILPFNLINRITTKNRTKKYSMILAFIFILCTMSYLGVMGGIRNMLAFSAFGYLLYFDLVEKKNIIFCFFVYITLALFHSSVIILVILRILLLFTKKYSFITISIFTLFWPLFLSFILNIIKNFGYIVFIGNLYNEAVSFSTLGSVYVYSTASIRLCSLVIIFASTLFCIYYHKNIKNYPDKYFKYIVLSILFIFGSIFQYDLFVRMVCFIIFSSPFVIITTLNLNMSDSSALQKSKFLKSKIQTMMNIKFILYIGLISVSALSLVFYTWSEYSKIIFSIIL